MWKFLDPFIKASKSKMAICARLLFFTAKYLELDATETQLR